MADYTRLSHQDIIKLVARYDLGKLITVTPMEGGQANSSMKLKTGSGTFILSVCDEKGAEEVQCLTQVLAHLVSSGLPTTRPIAANSGDYVISYRDKPVYIKAYIQGDVKHHLSHTMIRDVGKTMAILHGLKPLECIPGQFPYGRSNFEEVLSGNLNHPYLEWLRDKSKDLDHFMDPEQDKAMIHGDIFWDNLIFSGDHLAGLIDFEEVCFYYRLFDLGMCSVGCCSHNGYFDIQKIKSLLDGYQDQMPLTVKEKEQFKWFLVYAAAAGSFWRFRQYNIRYPHPDKKDNYLELVSLADQVYTMDIPGNLGF